MTATPARPYRRVFRWLLRQLEHGLALFGLGVIVYFSCFNLSRVISNSMAPTIQGKNWGEGDLVLTDKVSYRIRQPRRWEVITFRADDGKQVMKRVLGLPGEDVQMCRRCGEIRINGTIIEKPEYLKERRYYAYGNLIEWKPVACEDGYYVLGDDSRDSDDSRFNGPVRPDQVIGRAWLILTPPDRRGFVNP